MIMFGIGTLKLFKCLLHQPSISGFQKLAVIAPFEYVALPLSILWSITIFGDWPDIVSWLGIILIAGSGLYVVYSETVQGRKKDLYRPIPRNR